MICAAFVTGLMVGGIWVWWLRESLDRWYPPASRGTQDETETVFGSDGRGYPIRYHSQDGT